MGPVFIVGMNGSGTTMLLDHLDKHPSLFGFPLETKILPHYLTAATRIDLRDDGAFLRLYREIGNTYPFLIANRGSPLEPPASWRELARSPAAIFDCIMIDFAARVGKRRWCEKSPGHIQHIALLAEAFPDAQFIHVIRDGRDCAASFHRRWGYTPESTIYRWRRSVMEGRRQGVLLERSRYLEVRYESLTAQPASEMRKVCHFLGITFTEDMLLAGRDTSRVKGLSELQMIENSGRFKTYFSPRQIQSLEKIAGSTLAALGYDCGAPTACYDPPKFIRRWWHWTDRGRFAVRLLIGRARSSQPFPWRLLASRARRSLRHVRSERF